MVTLREVADEAGVSASTVSAVLTDQADVRRIPEATRQRVRHAAERLGYYHNALAKSLRAGKSNLVGIIGHGYPLMHHMLRVEAAARALIAVGFQVSMQNLAWRPDQQASLLKELLSLRVQGLLLDGASRTDEVRQILLSLARQSFPIVRLDLTDDVPVDLVTVDREQGAYMATCHLLKLGHRRIAYALNKNHPGVATQDRLRGFHRAHEEWEVEVDDTLVLPFPTELAEFPGYPVGYDCMQRVLDLRPRPTALLTNDDHIAIGALGAAFEAGVQVPGDIALVGFTGYPEGQYCPVPLTTVAYPFDDMAREAVRMLRERMAGTVDDAEPRLVTLEPQLIVRRSCGGQPIAPPVPTGNGKVVVSRRG